MRDKDVLDISSDIHASRKGRKLYDVLLYGSTCRTLHIVPVPVDGGTSKANTFEDLALEYWLPTFDEEYPHIVDLDRNNATIDTIPGGEKLDASYSVIFCPKADILLHTNELVGKLSRLTNPKWRGSVVVVKQTSRGVKNITEEDIQTANTVTRFAAILLANSTKWGY
ncbi:hypothetical protein GALMADRAFT_144300 [Galerina marginata CBS 339.88]|uniref:Uncharacterized protein n=1 Tax=Galerina marginata (strain CBS 339.88) TaxID=685588 RepID=A0A067SIS2_GALM3|nr:hypothetical protein GALMADRAFT_144300 [Galerina marginata CBS 339.88]